MGIDNQCATKLRALRLKRGLTLGEIERETHGEFKSVVLGAYERGARAVSLARLERLSAFYEVPMSYFFLEERNRSTHERWIFDLRQIRKVLEMGGEPSRIHSVIALIRAIAQQRNDWGGEFLTIRESDRAIAHHLLDGDDQDLESELLQRKMILNN